jgi:hypothetical protein
MLTETAAKPRVERAERRSTMKAAVFVAPGAQGRHHPIGKSQDHLLTVE